MSDVFETRTVTGPNGVEYEVKFMYDRDYGPTPLIAAMRCYCCAKLGDEVDIPDELV